MNIRANSTFKAGDFARLEALIVPRLIAAVDNATQAVLETSQTLAPVDTGDLVSSGDRTTAYRKGTKVQGAVFYTSEHASFVEFGTGLIGSGTYPFDLPQSGVPITGSWVYDYKHQNWQGMRAQPYLRPSLDISRAAIMQAFTDQGFGT